MNFVWKGVVCVLLFLSAQAAAGWFSSDERVLLKDVKAITFHRGGKTNSRRTSSVSQIECVGGTANCAEIPEVVQCTNQGSDGTDVQWKCEADMSDYYRFGKLSVNCEGYDYPTDPYILRNSCGLKFNLDLTEKGKTHYRDGHRPIHPSSYSSLSNDAYYSKSSLFDSYHHLADYWSWMSAVKRMFQIMVFLIVGYALFLRCCSNKSASNTHWRDYLPNWGTGATHQTSGYVGLENLFRSYPAKGADTTTNNNNSGYGFWSGAGLGGALGYLFGNRRSPQVERQQQTQPQYHYNTEPAYVRPHHKRVPSPKSPDEGTRTAKGFGETTRR